ncbi:MAG: NAD(P)/FAD-dependent oxidoreductase [candidate division WOR-3 bacterium]|nr:NAD(P)/FAD-dependent oxidoreductase [candidate division WOR-3 bacterium]
MDYDVVIIGAGPAGSTTGMYVAHEGFNVLVIDKKIEPGQPVQCAEYIPALLLREIQIPSDAFAHEIKGLKVYFPDKGVYEFSAPGYILNRSLFDKYLAIKAIQEGATLWLKTKFTGIENNRICLLKDGRTIRIATKILVGADGPNSKVSRIINGDYKDYIVAYQQELPLTKEMAYTEVYFDPKFFGGYAWLFPKKETANVGIGIKAGYKANIKDLHREFVQKLVAEKKVIDIPVRITTGLIPAGGPVAKTVYRSMLLVGDAAGQTHPVTGAGIPQAIICGKFAARAIISALKNGDLNLLYDYEVNWHNLYLSELVRALNKRKKMEENWYRLNEILKECWVSFFEYYE